ncbi:MAG: hypothetical protein V4556_00080 [Bacteroidota bacterium]
MKRQIKATKLLLNLKTFSLFTFLLIQYSCNIKICKSQNILYDLNGFLIVSSNKDLVFCASNEKKIDSVYYSNIPNTLNGFSIFGKYGKCLDQRLNLAFDNWGYIKSINKNNFANECKTESLNSLFYNSDSIKIIPVNIEYRITKNKSHKQRLKLSKESFCYLNSNILKKINYTIEDEIYIYNIYPLIQN